MIDEIEIKDKTVMMMSSGDGGYEPWTTDIWCHRGMGGYVWGSTDDKESRGKNSATETNLRIHNSVEQFKTFRTFLFFWSHPSFATARFWVELEQKPQPLLKISLRKTETIVNFKYPVHSVKISRKNQVFMYDLFQLRIIIILYQTFFYKCKNIIQFNRRNFEKLTTYLHKRFGFGNFSKYATFSLSSNRAQMWFGFLLLTASSLIFRKSWTIV